MKKVFRQQNYFEKASVSATLQYLKLLDVEKFLRALKSSMLYFERASSSLALLALAKRFGKASVPVVSLYSN